MSELPDCSAIIDACRKRVSPQEDRMPSRQGVILLSSALVLKDDNICQTASEALQGIDKVKIQVLKDAKVSLSDEQHPLIPTTNTAQFAKGPVAAFQIEYSIKSEDNDNDCKQAVDSCFNDLKKKLKVKDANAVVFLQNQYFCTQMKKIFFDNRDSEAGDYERSLVVFYPSLIEPDLNDMYSRLKEKGLLTLNAVNMSSNKHQVLRQLVPLDSDSTGKHTVLVCEGVDCNDRIKLLFGVNKNDSAVAEQYDQYSPELKEALQNTFSYNNENNYRYSISRDSNECDANMDSLFENPFECQRALFIMKSEVSASVEKKNQILDVLKKYQFTIISMKTISKLDKEYAGEFSALDSEKKSSESDALAESLAAGSITVLIVEKISALKCLRTVLNHSSQSQIAPESIYYSHSDSLCNKEIEFFFPEVTMPLTEQEMQDTENIVEAFMSQMVNKKETDASKNETMYQFLVRGLTELAKAKPSSDRTEVISWFANWLITNNPNKPTVASDSDRMENVSTENVENILDNLSEIDDKKIIENKNLSFKVKCNLLLKKYNIDTDANALEEVVKFIFVLGGPGSGKGTQCDNIVSNFDFIHISTGDILRRIVGSSDADGGELVKEIQSIMKQGKLISNEIMINLLENEILTILSTKLVALNDSASPEKISDVKPAFKYLIDGFPRTLEQTILFEKDILQTKFAVYFQLDKSVLLERCLARAKKNAESGQVRSDDNETTIKKRLVTFEMESLPVVDYLQSFDKVKVVDASQDINTVWDTTKQYFEKL